MNNSLGILLAEDDQNDVLLLQRAFERAKIQNPLFVARDGEEAMNFLSGCGHFSNRTEYPLPSLALFDLKMPKVSGFELLKWLRAQPALSCLPVVVFSSSNDPHDIEEAYRQAPTRLWSSLRAMRAARNCHGTSKGSGYNSMSRRWCRRQDWRSRKNFIRRGLFRELCFKKATLLKS